MVIINWIPMDSVLFRLVKIDGKIDLNVINLKIKQEKNVV